MLLTCCVTMLVTGLSCGFGCNPQINYFLSTCVLCTSDGIRRAFRVFLSFYGGKMLSVLAFCVITSCLGRIFILDILAPYTNVINGLINLSFILIGIITIWKTQRGSEHKCSGNCCSEGKSFYALTPAAVGAVYGISPCAPFLMLLGYSATVTPPESILLGFIFTLANALSPVLILILAAGLLSAKMYQRVPDLVGHIKIAMSIVLILVGAVRILMIAV